MLDRSRHVVDSGSTTADIPEVVTKPSSRRRPNKYTLKPACVLSSKYEQEMKDRVARTLKRDADAKIVAEATARRERRELSRGTDPLFGLRTHAWVLVLQGKRGVPENFFIECSLGETFSCRSSEHYLGIEAIWNSKNAWVNMQDCTEGVRDLQYDLGDSACWEYVLPDTAGHAVVSTAVPGGGGGGVVDMPVSWVEEIEIDPLEFETRRPHGTTSYTNAESRTTEVCFLHIYTLGLSLSFILSLSLRSNKRTLTHSLILSLFHLFSTFLSPTLTFFFSLSWYVLFSIQRSNNNCLCVYPFFV